MNAGFSALFDLFVSALKSWQLRLGLILIFFVPQATQAQQTRDLDHYLLAGVANSPMLYDSTNRYRSNAIDSLKILAGYRPQVTANGQVLLAPVAGKFGYDSAITNGGNYSGVVYAEQQLFNRHPKQVQFRNITLLNQALRLNLQLSEMDLRKSITAQYIIAFSDLSQVEFNKKLLEILETSQEGLKRLVKNGIYLQTDYVNLDISIQTQKIAIKRAQMQYRSDLYALNLLCGINDRSEVILLKPEIPVRSNFFVSSSPQMLRYHIDSLRISNARKLIDLQYRPRLSVFADGGVNAVNPHNIPHNFGTSFGLNFTTVLYDGHQRRLEYNRLTIQESTRRKYRDYYFNQYVTQVNQLQEKLHDTEELIPLVQEKIAAQERLLEMYKIEIFKGLSDLVRFTDFILNITNYTATQNELIQAENERLQILNELNYLK